MMAQWLRRLQNEASARTAVAGNGSGTVAVPARANYIYARLGASDGEVVEVHSALVTPAEGDTILIQRDTGGAIGQWRLVGLG